MMTVFVWYDGRVVDSFDVTGKTKEGALRWVKSIIGMHHGDNAPYHLFTYTVEEKAGCQKKK